MEIRFKAELEDKLNQIASTTGRQAAEVVQELVEAYLDHDQWFRQEVQKGLAQLDRGELISHDDVLARVERILRS